METQLIRQLTPAVALRFRRRRLLAITVSAAVHVLAALALLASASGAPVSGGAAAESGAPSMVVTLVRMPPAAEPSGAHGALRPLVARAREDAMPPLIVETRPGPSALQRLADRLRRDNPDGSQPAPSAPKAPPPKSPRGEADQAEVTEAPSNSAGRQREGDGPTTGSLASGGLWGRIEPCWRKVATPSTVPVSLEIALDRHGRLKAAPVILRGGAPADERRLSSEAAALAALAGCLPQGDVRFGDRVHRLDFGPAPP